ncbi:MAG: putative GTPase, family [Oscillospiraceae bacterium]|nr:putative GTPase, family [Oscillospiraceae bacterium]
MICALPVRMNCGKCGCTRISIICLVCQSIDCCSNVIKELLDRFQPDKIIIEPSGVGKLSDIIKACSDSLILPFATVKASITVADVKRCKRYLDNFGEFFEDQIQNADLILLSRTELFPDKVNDAYKLMKSLNPHAVILSKPRDQIHAAEMISPQDHHHEHTECCGHARGCGCETIYD